MENTLCFWTDIFLNWKLICNHYNNKILLPLSLTCKLFNKIYTLNNNYDCDICHYRNIICGFCIKNNTKSCYDCNCYYCNVSINLSGQQINNGLCHKCEMVIHIDDFYRHYNERVIHLYNLKRVKIWGIYDDDITFLDLLTDFFYSVTKKELPKNILNDVITITFNNRLRLKIKQQYFQK